MPDQQMSKPALILIAAAAIVLAGAFFLPWVKWDDTAVAGSAIANGTFFQTTETDFGLANPFPALAPAMMALWALPLLALLSVVMVIWLRRPTLVPVLAGMIGIGLVTLFVLFSGSLVDLGVNYTVQPGLLISGLASALLVLVAARSWLLKIALILVIPLATYAGFSYATGQVEEQEFESSANLESDFAVNADALISEFRANDSLANAKYREKLVTVSGAIAGIEIASDSAATVKFADSTGSYVIFPLQDEDVAKLKKMKDGDPLTVKGSCSGGVFSEILESETISFKRCTIVKP